VTPEAIPPAYAERKEALKPAAAAEKLGLWYEARRTIADAAASSS